MFQLKLLGSLSLQDERGPVPPGAQQKRRLGLLALLAVGGDRGVSRDQLQAYLSPESPASRSRHSLDQLVYATRRSLGSDPFVSAGATLRLNQSVVDTDLRCFREAVCSGRWLDAAGLYRGPLLDGFHISDSRELESWIDSERATVDRDYHKAMETLARQAASDGDHAAASSWWLKLAASDPLSARVAAEVIKAFAASGDPAQAIHYGRSYQERVRSELEVEPDPAIEKLIGTLARPKVADSSRPQSLSQPETRPDVAPVQLSIIGGESDTITIGERATHRRVMLRTSLLAGLIATALIGSFAVFMGARGEKLPRGLVSGERSTASAHPARAHETYLRGVNAWSERSKEGLDTAVVYFRRAIELDPAYADAYAGLANAYVLLGYSGYRPADAMFPKAKAAALRAIQLDSTLSAPYAAMGMELTGERNFRGAEAAYRTAIARDPKYATAHQWYGILLMILGRIPEAVDQTRRAAELDPLSLQIQNTYATFLSASGQHEGALRHYQKVVGEEPDSAWVRRNPWLLTNMAAVYRENGEYDKALRFAKRSVEIAPRHPRTLLALASIYLAMGDPEIARQVFARADTLNEQYAAYRAMMYLAEGNADSAFMWLDRVKEWGIPILISLQTSQDLYRLRDDPRRRALFNRLGLPPRASATMTR